MADRDALTGLFSRRRFEEELARHVSRVARYGPDGAAIVLDVDHFRQVSDTLGRHAGDELIGAVAALLRSSLRDSDIVARLADDQFAILLPHADHAEAEDVAIKLVRAGRERLSTPELPAKVTISVGVTMFDAGLGLTAAQVLVDADVARYHAKAAGRDGYAFFFAGIRDGQT
jgi:diguanylate cyclase (GGDEF)-like protein